VSVKATVRLRRKAPIEPPLAAAGLAAAAQDDGLAPRIEGKGKPPHAYCAQPTVLRIPSVPDEVCLAHAIEFWTGLVAYAKDRLEGGQEKAPRGRGAS
jgi:hypothetical protein